MVLEGGFRGWEAHDLPTQQMETTVSQAECDQLALNRSCTEEAGYGRHSPIAASIVMVSPLLVEANTASPEKTEAQRTVAKTIFPLSS